MIIVAWRAFQRDDDGSQAQYGLRGSRSDSKEGCLASSYVSLSRSGALSTLANAHARPILSAAESRKTFRGLISTPRIVLDADVSEAEEGAEAKAEAEPMVVG